MFSNSLRFPHFILWLLVVFTAVACAKKQDNGGTSVISLVAPEGRSNKVGAFAALPSNRRACFGVNITADDIASVPGTACSPKAGIVAGFVESGGTIQIEVPRGDNRKFELYMYLMAEGETVACPTMARVFASSELPKLYFLGATPNISIRKAVEDVTITADFPGLSQTLAVTNSYPASCVAATTPNLPPSQAISTATGNAVGSGIRLSGRIGEVKDVVLVGGGIRLKTK